MEAVLMRIALERSSDHSDQELVERSLSGDTRAYEQLVVRYQRLVFRVLWSRGADPQDIEDLAQETFTRAWQHLHTFDPGRPFKAWIAQVAGNLAIDHHRARSRRPLLVDLPNDETTAFPVGDPGRCDDVDPAQMAQSLDDERGVLQALHQLPELYREALVLRFVEDLPYDQIAAALHLPLGSVKTRIFRGRELLKQRLIAAGRATADQSGA